ncbi:MAG: IS66 family transposase [Nitrososphaera sp.]
MKPLSICENCLEKQRTIDRLTEENKSLKDQLRYRQRRAEDGPFGSSTPSSKIPVKANSPEEQRRRRGGAKEGHVGHGRSSVDASSANRIEQVDVAAMCPECGSALEDKGYQDRSVIESRPIRAERILYRLEKKYCPRCRKTIQAQAPGILPKSLYGNQLITQTVFWHYLHGIPIGRVCEQAGIGLGTVIEIFHRMATMFRGVVPKLIEEYRQSPVRHADETGWRTDGRSGYAWLFSTPSLSIFLFRSTRSSSVPKEVLGQKTLSGVLVVDRYNAYNRAPCALQYCFAHLLRELEDLAKEVPDHSEITAFTATMIPLLSQAMHLHSQLISDSQYYEQACQIQEKIKEAIQAPAQHFGIRRIQDIFSEKAHRLYHWVTDRNVPADNNRAERELRPTVIARKVSFGSQSDAGAKTREILMTLVQTLKKRLDDPQANFKSVLDKQAADPTLTPLNLLFPLDSS